MSSLHEPRPRGMPALCGSPAPGTILGGLRWLIATRASLLQEASCILQEPRPRGDSWWSARLDRDEGVAPTKMPSYKDHRAGSIKAAV